jgi:hypothetical protein
MKEPLSRLMPLDLIRGIVALDHFDTQGFVKDNSDEYYLLLKDPDPDSNFFFGISDVDLKGPGKIVYTVVYKPTSTSDIDPVGYPSDWNTISQYFEKWADIIKEYASHIPRQNYEEPILEQYAEEEFVHFNILEDDAEKNQSNPIEVQLFIDAYLSDVVKRLETYKQRPELDQPDLEAVNEIIEEAESLKKNQTRQTKIQVAKSLSRLWAKARKAGLEVYTEVRKEALKEFAKFGVKEFLSDPSSIFNGIVGLLD